MTDPNRRRRTAVAAAIGAVALTLILVGGFWVLKSHRTFLVSEGRTFYVSQHGDDRADGRSPTRPWRTLGRVNTQRLNPGDQVLLKGGDTFTGSLHVDEVDAGDSETPVVFASYGGGRATIDVGYGRAEPAISVHNTAGVTIRDLVVMGRAGALVDGVVFYNDMSPARRLGSVTVERVDVSGFKAGISVGSGPGSLGFRGVRLRDSTLHRNRVAGLVTYGPPFDPGNPSYAHEDVAVTGVTSYANLGAAGTDGTSGSGIALSSVRGGLIDRCTAHTNGALSDYVEGPIGIFSFDSTAVVIQNNLSYGNRTSKSDGGGFGLDRNVSDSVLQYNLSYDNDGAGILLFGDAASPGNSGNTVRFNVSSHDSRRNDFHGAVSLVGGLQGPSQPGGIVAARILQNTLVMGAASDGALPPALKISDRVAATEIRNNILISMDDGPLVRSLNGAGGGTVFTGNDYFAAGERFALDWEGESFTSLARWRAASGQETVAGAPTGTTEDPGLGEPGPPRTVLRADQLTTARGFALNATSPVIGAGIRFPGYDPGPRDFFGVPIDGRRTDIGASHFPGP